MKYRLTSIGVDIMCLSVLFGCMSLAVVLTIYREQVPLFGIIFMWMMVALLSFGICLLFTHTISLNYKKRKLIVGVGVRIVRKSIEIDEIQTIIVVKDSILPKKQLSTIVVKLKNGKCYKTGGCHSVFRRNNVHKTESIVAQLNDEIAKLQSKK